MLRLSVVHSPSGPQMGPGLDDDIQSPGLEERHLYTGPNKFDYWNPYDNGGENERQQDPIKELKSCKVLAMDYDSTVLLDPRFCKKLIDALRSRGTKVYLLTGRSKSESSDSVAFMSRHSISFDGDYFYPVTYDRTSASWDMLMDSRISLWKERVLEELKADTVIDNNLAFLTHLARRNPGITALMPYGG